MLPSLLCSYTLHGCKYTELPQNKSRSLQLAPKLQGFNKGSEIKLKGFPNHETEICIFVVILCMLSSHSIILPMIALI